MIKEANRWFLANYNFIIVPSINDNISGDLGYRSIVKIDPSNIDESSFYDISYSEDFFRIYREREISFFLYILNGKKANPIFFSDYTLNQITINNFNLENYSVGDNVSIYNKDTLEKIIDANILNINGENITLSNPIPTRVNRYKLINTTGSIYYITQNLKTMNYMSHKIRFGNKIYANT